MRLNSLKLGTLKSKYPWLIKKADVVSILFQVSDSGIGIPEHALDRIFEQFFRIEPAYKTQTKSRGFGIAFCSILCSVIRRKN